MAPILDRRPHLYPLYRILTRELGTRRGAGELRQRKIIDEHYLGRGRAASTYWRHRRELREAGLLSVDFAASGPRWGPGARRRLVLIFDWARSQTTGAPSPQPPREGPAAPMRNARTGPGAAHGPPAMPEGLPGIRSAADLLAHLRRS